MEKLDPGHSEWSKNIFSVHFSLKMLPINSSSTTRQYLKKIVTMSDFMMFFHEFGCADVFFVPDSTSKNKVQVIFLCVCFFAYKIVTAHIRLRLVHSEKKKYGLIFFLVMVFSYAPVRLQDQVPR